MVKERKDHYGKANKPNKSMINWNFPESHGKRPTSWNREPLTGKVDKFSIYLLGNLLQYRCFYEASNCRANVKITSIGIPVEIVQGGLGAIGDYPES